MDKDEHVLVCNRIDRPKYLSGYTSNCDECDAQIWISHSSTEMLTGSTKKICIECFVKDHPEDFNLVPPEGESLDAICKYTGLTKEQALEQFSPEKTKEQLKKKYGIK